MPAPRRRRGTAATASSTRVRDPSARGGSFSPLAQSMIGKKRKQMRVFLGELLEGGRVEGLYWTNKGKMTFRMPWKHAKKKDYDASKDTELIKLWAINTGRFGRLGQDADPTAWKINFRCALNSLKESIVEMENNEDEDYRLYRFDDNKRGRLKSRPTEFVQELEPVSPSESSGSSSDSSSSVDSPMSMDDVVEDALVTSVPTTVGTHTAINGYVSTFPATASTVQANDLWSPDNQQICDDSLQQLLANITDPTEGTDPEYSDTLMACMMNTSDSMSTATTILATSPTEDEGQSSGIATGTAASAATTAATTTATANTAARAESGNDSGVENDEECLPDCHEVYVKVCYRGSPVAGMKVENRSGCRIFFGPCVAHPGLSAGEHERLFGGRQLMQLSLPAPGQAQSILPSIWYLLDSMQRGIIIEVISNDIYATRLCNANVYWGAPAHMGDTCPLERGVRTRIFNYQLFLQIYKTFRDDMLRTAVASQPPACNVLLGVGQPWGPDRCLENNLVMVSLTHCLAEHLMEMLHRYRWEMQRPFDTDFLMIDPMDEDDKLAVCKTKQVLETMKDKDKEKNGGDASKLTPMNLSSLPVTSAS